jgi:hemerythrin-like domain-containing protein
MCDHCGCRSFAEIADLTAEHDRILELAWQLTEHHTVDRAELIELLTTHVDKEEQAFYPLLVACGGVDAETVAVLEAEHTSIDGHLASVTFGRREYYELAAHIEHEEMELFPAAMFGFEDDDWAALRAHAGRPAVR